MSVRRTLLTFACLLTSPAGNALVAQTSAAPTLILTGGKVFTADSTNVWAEAIAIRGERIVGVGATDAIRRMAGTHTREIPLAGRVVIPGINDSHEHVGNLVMPGEFATSMAPMPDPAFSVVLDSVRAIASRTPKGTWIKTTIGLRVLDDAAARRPALDRASPDHPVFLWAGWGHGAVLNSAALHVLGIAEYAHDPLGGWYERDSTGRLTGRLDEYAEFGAARRMYSMQPERALVAALRAFADSELRLGVTTVQNMAGDLTPSVMLRAMRDANLPIRMRLIRWSIPDERGRNEEEWNVPHARPAPRVAVSGRKWVLDGTPLERNALQRKPYTSGPATAAGPNGRLNFPLDTVRAILAGALLPDAQQLALHVVGDSTPVLVMGLMTSLAPDSVWRTKRVRFEHTRLRGAAVERARALGIVVSQIREGMPLKTWSALGIPLAYGSDAVRLPFYNLMIAVGGGRPGNEVEALTREQAVTMYTRGSAYAEFAEQEKGTIAPGMLADIAVLSQDIFTVPILALPGTRSVLTVVGGKVVLDERGKVAMRTSQ